MTVKPERYPSAREHDRFCFSCRKWKEYEHFRKQRQRADGTWAYAAWCKECHKEYNRVKKACR